MPLSMPLTDHTIPSTMAAMVLVGHGGLDKLEYHSDWPTPVPGPDDVLIRVAACGMNNTDINTRTAWYSSAVTTGVNDGGATGFDSANDEDGAWSGRGITFPRIQGADVSGRIVSVGQNVSPRRIGERIMISPWIHGQFGNRSNWQDSYNTGYFGSESDGGFAEYCKVRSENAVTLNSDLPDVEVATLATVLITAEHLIYRTELQPGETVAIAGASGGVGTMAIQLAKLRGAEVIAIANPIKTDALMAMGCKAVVDRDSDDLTAAIKDAAGGPVDVGLDVVGGSQFMPLLKSIRMRGRYSSSGAIAGPVVPVDLRAFYYRDIKMTGATVAPPGMFERCVKLVEQNKVKAALAGTYPLKELHAAQEAFMAKGFVGNLVIEC